MPAPLLKSRKKRREKKHDDSLKQLSEAKLKNYPGSPTAIAEFDGSEWHKWIHARDWDSLLCALGPKEMTDETANKKAWSPKRQLSKGFRHRFSRGSLSSPTSEQQPRSTLLLSRDSNGDTPLHLALTQNDTPIDVLVELLRANSDLAATENRKGQLALHLAVREQHAMKVIAELVIVNPAGVLFADHEGKTPLDFAVDIAKKEYSSKVSPKLRNWVRVENEDDTDSQATLRWQDEQYSRWAVVKWLLLASASHPRTSLNVGKNKQSLLLDALLHSAPPTVISLLIAATIFEESRGRGTSFACSALYLCITRRYPPQILKSLASRCPRQAGIVRDETGMGLVSAQYIVGCFRQAGAEGWVVHNLHKEMMERCWKNKCLNSSIPFTDWWEKVKFLIGYCQNGVMKISDEQLLHAALRNSDTPSSVIQLLLALYPGSMSLRDPISGAHPLHLACMTGSYLPRNYEISPTGTGTVVEMVLKEYPKAVRYRFHDKTPLHLAIEAGKTWAEIKPLTSAHRRSLAKRDPTTKLYPFQMMALRRRYTEEDKVRLSHKARNSCSNTMWRNMSPRLKANKMRRMKETEDLERLRISYEFLRRNPGLVKGGIVRPKAIQKVRDTTGMGMVAAHFTVWCYASEKEHWRPLEENQGILQDVIRTGTLNINEQDEKSKEFGNWWTKLKFWIWYCYCGEEGSIPKEGTLVMPRTDEYLLHAAASNSDTPPQVIDLLLSLFPSSASLPLPQTDMYPLHIAAATTSYTSRAFESQYPSTLSLLLRVYPGAARLKCNDRLPLHIGIEAGKTWEELEPLVVAEKRALRCPDSQTRLYPSQLVAVRHTYTPEQRLRFQYLARNRTKDKVWMKMSEKRRSREMSRVQKEHQRSVLSTVFELLRMDPAVVKIRENATTKDEDSCAADHSDVIEIGHSPSRSLSPPYELGEEDELQPLQTATAACNQLFGDVDSFDDDAVNFSTFDVMSTISAHYDEVQTSSVIPRASSQPVADYDESCDADLAMPLPSKERKQAHDEYEEAKANWSNNRTSLGSFFDREAKAASNKYKGGRVHRNGDSDDADVWSYVRQMEKELDDFMPETTQTAGAEANDVVALRNTTNSKEVQNDSQKSAQQVHNKSIPYAPEYSPAEVPGRLKPTSQSKRAPGPDLLKECIVEASEKLRHSRNSRISKLSLADKLKEGIVEASENLKAAPELDRSLAPDPLNEAIAKAPNDLRHSIPTHPERKPLFVEKGKDEVTDVEKRVGMYRTGWAATPAIRDRRDNRFGNYKATQDQVLPCILCGNGKREVLMLPCRHLCLCSRCSVTKKVTECQTCGKEVKDWMTVFL